jgi:hypothetical protein
MTSHIFASICIALVELTSTQNGYSISVEVCLPKSAIIMKMISMRSFQQDPIKPKENLLPKTNYQYEKRRRELDKKKKQAEKQRLKEERKNSKPEEHPSPSSETQTESK